MLVPACPARLATFTTCPCLFSSMSGRKACGFRVVCPIYPLTLMVQKCAITFTSKVLTIL